MILKLNVLQVESITIDAFLSYNPVALQFWDDKQIDTRVSFSLLFG